MIRHLACFLAALAGIAAPAGASAGPLRIEITEGVIEPLPFAVPDFVPASPAAAGMAAQIARVVAEDLTGTGLFREIPASAFISARSAISTPRCNMPTGRRSTPRR